MRRQGLWVLALAGVGYLLVTHDALMPGLLALAAAAAVAYRASKQVRGGAPQIPVAYAHARRQAEQIVQSAQAQADAAVRRAERKAKKHVKSVTAAANAQIAAEAAERWIV